MSDSRRIERNPALARLCAGDLLSAEEEQFLFRRLKQVRLQSSRQRRIASGGPLGCETKGRSVTISTLSDEAIAIRNRIVESNLRLVVALAKHYAAPDRSIEDLVSEAAIPLLRCVERFDPCRGTRFSTYATHALKNLFGKLRRRDGRLRGRISSTADLSDMADTRERTTASDRLIRTETLRTVADRLAALPRRERTLVRERFGLTGDGGPRTFRELGVTHGLSKERVRVITSEAISRLGQSFAQESCTQCQTP